MVWDGLKGAWGGGGQGDPLLLPLPHPGQDQPTLLGTPPSPSVPPLDGGILRASTAPHHRSRRGDRHRLSRPPLLYNSHLLVQDLIPDKSTNFCATYWAPPTEPLELKQ